MKSRTFERLPPKVQARARSAYRVFLRDPGHPGLRFKPVHHARPIYSVRIGLAYRALGVRENDEIIWFWIGSHADYDEMLKQIGR